MNRIVILILLVSTALFAAQNAPKKTDSNITFNPYPTWNHGPTILISNDSKPLALIEIRDKDGKTMVLISPDGKVTYGANYKADESAKTFWEALALTYPSVCKQFQVPPAPKKQNLSTPTGLIVEPAKKP
jgi:hypothetical protein